MAVEPLQGARKEVGAIRGATLEVEVVWAPEGVEEMVSKGLPGALAESWVEEVRSAVAVSSLRLERVAMVVEVQVAGAGMAVALVMVAYSLPLEQGAKVGEDIVEAAPVRVEGLTAVAAPVALVVAASVAVAVKAEVEMVE